MRIAIDVQSTLGAKTGIGQYTAKLLEAMQRIAPQHEFLPLHLGQDIRMRTDRRLRWQQIQLPRSAKAARADLLHVPGFDAPLRKPAPVVLTVHDLIGRLFPQNMPPVARFYWAAWLPFSIRWADHIISDSESTRQDILRLTRVRSERITVIPLGVDAQFTPITDAGQLEAVRKRYRLPERFILFVGTLEPRKGLDTLVEAYASLAPELPHDLVIAGKAGWYTQALFEQVEQLGIHQRVHFTDYLPDQTLPALYNLSELFVFPSRYEGFGLPPLEAMACGVPVICTNASSLPEVVEDAAIMVHPGDSHTLALAVKHVLENPLRQAELITRGHRQAARFRWEETARRTLEVYEAALCG